MAVSAFGGKHNAFNRSILKQIHIIVFCRSKHPYPTEDEKRAIAAQTNLTLLQVCIEYCMAFIVLIPYYDYFET